LQTPLQITFYAANAVHIAEAYYAYRLATGLGLTTAASWAVQTSIVSLTCEVPFKAHVSTAWHWIFETASGVQETRFEGCVGICLIDLATRHNNPISLIISKYMRV
jgi:hypothetical protein